MRRMRPLNHLGLWLVQELDRRNLSRIEFAELVHIKPQNLSDLICGNRYGCETLRRWELRFQDVLAVFDQGHEKVLPIETAYQIICTEVIIEGVACFTYGLQMLVGTTGQYRIADEIRDISFDPAMIQNLADRCNAAKVSEVHFRDVVMDSIA